MGQRTDPDNDWQVLCVRRCVDIKEQAVFITWTRIKAIYGRGLGRAGLWTERGLGYGLNDVGVPRWGLGCLPTQLANRRSGVSYATEYVSIEFSRVSGIKCLAVAAHPLKTLRPNWES